MWSGRGAIGAWSRPVDVSVEVKSDQLDGTRRVILDQRRSTRGRRRPSRSGFDSHHVPGSMRVDHQIRQRTSPRSPRARTIGNRSSTVHRSARARCEVADRGRGRNPASLARCGVRRSLEWRFRFCDALLNSRSRPLDEFLGRIVEVRHDARLEQSATLGRAHLFEFRSGHDVLGHTRILQLSATPPSRTALTSGELGSLRRGFDSCVASRDRSSRNSRRRAAPHRRRSVRSSTGDSVAHDHSSASG